MIELIRTILSTILKGRNWIEKLPKSYIFLTSRYHWYNIVSPSPWPILIGITSFPGVIGLVGTMHGLINGLELFTSSFVTFLFFFCMWNRDIIRESTFIGLHTKQVDKNTITGFKLFLFSEIMLFVTFFWAHLYSALYPSVFIGLSWPPVGLSHLLLDPFDIPWTNTLILVYSGLTVTVSHLYLRRGNIWLSGWAMFATIILGLAFLYIQKEEFVNSEFDISDGIYGSTFFMLTGFHGGHVIIGVTGLIVTLIRLIELHFSSYSHTGFKLALIYWHFVDVVWIFVFLIVYVLGSDLTFFNAVFTTTNGSGTEYCIINLEAATFGKYSRASDLFPFPIVPAFGNFDFTNKSKILFLQKGPDGNSFFSYKDYVINDQNVIKHDQFLEVLSSDPQLVAPYVPPKVSRGEEIADIVLEKNNSYVKRLTSKFNQKTMLDFIKNNPDHDFLSEKAIGNFGKCENFDCANYPNFLPTPNYKLRIAEEMMLKKFFRHYPALTRLQTIFHIKHY